MSTIIDPLATSAAINEGIEAASHLTTASQKQELIDVIWEVAKEKPSFTVDDVWEKLGYVINGSGLGPVMLRAQKAGLIAKNGLFKRSQRPATHGRPLPVWESLVVELP